MIIIFLFRKLLKIKDLVIHHICEPHREYDFGSYKRGYRWATENNVLKNYDNLIFCNDSAFGPFYSLESIFKSLIIEQK